MHRRRDLAVMSAVLEVQHAKRLAAEVEVQQALADEKTARDASAAAERSCEAAHEEWTDYVGRPGFSPEYSRALSARLLHRESEARDAAAVADRKGDVRASKQEAWRHRQVQVRQAELSAKHIKRRVEHRRDERRLAEGNDRVTYAWWRQ